MLRSCAPAPRLIDLDDREVHQNGARIRARATRLADPDLRSCSSNDDHSETSA